MHFYTFRLKIIFDPPPGGPRGVYYAAEILGIKARLQRVLRTCCERVVVRFGDCHRLHWRLSRRFHVELSTRHSFVWSSGRADPRASDAVVVRFRPPDAVFGVLLPPHPVIRADVFADPAASCCRLSLPPSLTLRRILKTVSQPFEVCVFFFRRKIGNFGYSFRPLGVFVKLRTQF